MRSRLHKNNRQQLFRRWLLSVIMVIIAATLTIFALNIYDKLTQTKSPTRTSGASVTSKIIKKANLPVRLKIPIISVDAAIYEVGLTSDGSMDVKPDQESVAWYEPGARPGNEGSAVIAGHYGWNGDKGSVFNELHSLKQGDKITIVDEKNKSINFIVRESREYDPDAEATDVFKSFDGKAHLNLITCDGDWINAKNIYSNRLVIFADQE